MYNVTSYSVIGWKYKPVVIKLQPASKSVLTVLDRGSESVL